MNALRSTLAASLIAVGLTAAQPALAQTKQTFPTKPVRFIVGFSPGSATDITARTFAPKLSEIWGQPVVIENRSGAGSTLANAMVAQATPDGHTLLVVSTSFAITAVLQGKGLPYDALRDFRGVSQFGSTTGALTVAPALGVKSAKEFIALARERPGKILFGSAGAGSGLHMSTERFNLAAGIKAVHVGFKGQPEMIIEIVTARVHYGWPGLGSVMPFIKDGRMLALAVNTPKRSPVLPDVPALVEILPNFERDAAHALMAPAKTPTAIVRQVSKDVARVAEMPDVKERMSAISFDLATTTPEEYDKSVRKQIEIFTQVAKAAGLISK
ncbi:MAG: tripartite tricarboxylate transporter substrate-binding protein [Pseudomonadota bacterium]